MRKILLFLLLFVSLAAMAGGNGFVVVRNGKLIRDGKPYQFIGVDYWYGPLIGSPVDGNRARLKRELDFLQKEGVTNLRAMVGVSGVSKDLDQLPFPLQIKPGVYDTNWLAGLDYFLAQLKKRHMTVVFFLTNNWVWTGGYVQYLAWAKGVPMPYPDVIGWPKYSKFVSQFYSCKKCTELFNNFCKFIITRTNQYTHVPYRDDPTIMAWEIANEPRPDGKQNKAIYKKWIFQEAKYLKSLDKNHLVTTGTEGEKGTANDINLWKAIHESPDIDYATIHIWAKNWNWIDFSHFDSTYKTMMVKMKRYLAEHAKIADELHKPLVVEEIGFPRDKQQFSPNATTVYRDRYFKTLFKIFVKGDYPSFQGVDIWAYGGEGHAANKQYKWKKGDQLTGDPPMEPQGLNSMLNTDPFHMENYQII